ncbi:MAG: response regulator [Mucilaginibacter sp.]|uniref:response regulator n=1 Tax=Mucilaginibacter sp. TaxID=1882438 RepID=UPI0031A0E6F4
MAKKILIVDHNELMTDVMSYILTGKGYDVIALNQADHIFTNINQNHPDLVILDSLLPGIDGVDICRLLKRNKATQALPVIICSYNDDADQSIQQIATPDDILHKPFGMSNLIEKVEYQLAA